MLWGHMCHSDRKSSVPLVFVRAPISFLYYQSIGRYNESVSLSWIRRYERASRAWGFNNPVRADKLIVVRHDADCSKGEGSPRQSSSKNVLRPSGCEAVFRRKSLCDMGQSHEMLWEQLPCPSEKDLWHSLALTPRAIRLRVSIFKFYSYHLARNTLNGMNKAQAISDQDDRTIFRYWPKCGTDQRSWNVTPCIWYVMRRCSSSNRRGGSHGSSLNTFNTLGQNRREQEAAKTFGYCLWNHEKQLDEFRLLDWRL